MSMRAILVAIGAVAVLQSPSGPRASDSYPFLISSPGGVAHSIVCGGPWFRTSGCVPIGSGAVQELEFYRARDTSFSPIGRWQCLVYRGDECASLMAMVDFCGPGVRGYPHSVHLKLAGFLTVNQLGHCSWAQATSVLGQNGEDGASPQQDIDTYSFAGKSGEAVDIKLGRDDSAGSAGDIATLRVRSPNGRVVAERIGAVPLALKATLSGPVEISVLRGPSGGAGLRGGYELEVVPASGDIGERKLRPTENVEH